MKRPRASRWMSSLTDRGTSGRRRANLLRRYQKGILLLVAELLFSLLPGPAMATEYIRNFTSDIRVHADSSLTIRERILVISEQREIRRGIYRDFPTDYPDGAGNTYRVTFEVESVIRDGRAEPYHTERQSNGVRLYIGNKDTLLPAGPHEYVITYTTTRQVGHFDGFDEIYWNATGNGWVFPIEQADARVHLPPGASVLQYMAYTGYQGQAGKDYRTRDIDGGIAFETSRPLAANEGLTIAVSWPEGLVERPSSMEKLGYLVGDNRILITGGIGIILLLIYYLAVWGRVGRDPAPGTIIPLFEPPAGYSPAAMRYIGKMGFDDKTFAAALLSMAVKGFLTIEEDKLGVYSLHKTGRKAPLSLGERAVARHLFAGSRDTIEMKKANHAKIRAARDSLKDWLRTEYEQAYFNHNRRHFYPGVGISIAIFALMLISARDPAGALFLSVWLAFWTVGVYFIVRVAMRSWSNFLTGRNPVFGISAVALTVMAVPFLGGEVAGLAFLAETLSFGGALIFLGVQLINLFFYHLLKAPTRLGRQVMDKFAGFADFLSVTEKDRMNFFNPPERTPELFERFLPYAIALDVENKWADQFTKTFADVHLEPGNASGYRPGWYHGQGFSPSNLSGFSSALGSGFAGAISSAATAPGSRGGSRGGGSSGGGGGGGGGGGW